MFRQVVSYRWAEGVTDEQKDAFRATLAGLREIPELVGLRFADDGRYFEGNFDVVAVMDFPDFTSARRYVADDRHQAYIRDYASKMIGERVVVQYDWAVGEVSGVQRVTVPVRDLELSRDWYAYALGFIAVDGSSGPDAVVMLHPSQPVEVELREDAARAQALAGFATLTFAVGTPADLDALLAATGVPHGERSTSSTGDSVQLVDPDGQLVRLTTLGP